MIPKVVMLRKARLTAAIVLLLAAFLPLSECSREADHKVTGPKTLGQHLYPQSTKDVSYQYAYKTAELNTFTVLTIVAFVWPLLFLFFWRRGVTGKKMWVLRIFELLLTAGSIYWINVLTYHSFGATWLYGAYAAVLAVVVFAACGFAEWFRQGSPPVVEHPVSSAT